MLLLSFCITTFILLQELTLSSAIRSSVIDKAISKWSLGREVNDDDRKLWRDIADLYEQRIVDEEAEAKDNLAASEYHLVPDDEILNHQTPEAVVQKMAPVSPGVEKEIPPNYFDKIDTPVDFDNNFAGQTARYPPPPGVPNWFSPNEGTPRPGLNDPVANCQPPWCYPAKCSGGLDNCKVPQKTCPPGQELKKSSSGELVCKPISDVCEPACRNGGRCNEGVCFCTIGFTGSYCQKPDFAQCLELVKRHCQFGCKEVESNRFNCICAPWILSNIASGNNIVKDEDNATCVLPDFDNIDVNLPCSQPCLHGGVCQYGRCVCRRGWTGSQCQQDVNECDDQFLSKCAFECENTFGSFKCICPEGYYLASNKWDCMENKCPHGCNKHGNCVEGKCVCDSGWTGDSCQLDVDECSRNLHNCQQNCVNVPGSYNCACSSGFRLLSDNRSCMANSICNPPCQNNSGACFGGRCMCKSGFTDPTCSTDVDECALKIDSCKHKCQNTLGSYICVCPPGLQLSADGISCDKGCLLNCSNGGVCYKEACLCPQGFHGDRCQFKIQGCTSPCMNGGVCTNGVCQCRTAFQGVSCQADVDECVLGIHNCEQLCSNTYGGYKCICRQGFIVNPQNSRACIREPDNSGNKLNFCSNEKPCFNNGSCADGRCLCSKYFTGDRCEIPVQEQCSPPCENGATCRNNRCICAPGYTGEFCERQLSADCPFGCVNGRCIDSKCVCDDGFTGNACDVQFLCQYNTDCEHGDCVLQSCSCIPGWSGSRCQKDVNECEDKKHTCQHKCVNEIGSYRCDCDSGFVLNWNGFCSWDGSPGCPKGCRNNGRCVKGRCRCSPGFWGDECLADIDECSLPKSEHGCEFGCHNTYGGYECRCPPGYERLGDKKTCRLALPDTTCKPACLNGGVCHENMCRCSRGFTGPDCSEDIDECLLYSPCLHKCINTVGSYSCTCPPNQVLRFDGVRCLTREEAAERPDLVYKGKGAKGHVKNSTTTAAP